MTAPWRLGEEPWIGTRRAPLARVIIDNDFAGDPDPYKKDDDEQQ